MPHAPRARTASRFPAHVTVKLRPGLPRLRARPEYAVLRGAFRAGRERLGMRLCHYAVLDDHLHLLVEARDRSALSRGVQGLLVRVAKRLNKLWRRRGTVFAERFHDHVLKTPVEVRNALRYLFQNATAHAARGGGTRPEAALDCFTSAPWFDGFREPVTVRGLAHVPRPVAEPHTWLLRTGWRRLGLLSIHELPASSRAGVPRCDPG